MWYLLDRTHLKLHLLLKMHITVNFMLKFTFLPYKFGQFRTYSRALIKSYLPLPPLTFIFCVCTLIELGGALAFMAHFLDLWGKIVVSSLFVFFYICYIYI